jgi:hypothetical protein
MIHYHFISEVACDRKAPGRYGFWHLSKPVGIITSDDLLPATTALLANKTTPTAVLFLPRYNPTVHTLLSTLEQLLVYMVITLHAIYLTGFSLEMILIELYNRDTYMVISDTAG